MTMGPTGLQKVAYAGHVFNHEKIIVCGCVGDISKGDEFIFGTLANDYRILGILKNVTQVIVEDCLAQLINIICFEPGVAGVVITGIERILYDSKDQTSSVREKIRNHHK